MTIAIILAGGTGTRMKMGNMPKQYLFVAGRPIITYGLKTFQQSQDIDGIVIVAEEEWRGLIDEWIVKDGITKFCKYALPGKSRQHSIYSGLKTVADILETIKKTVKTEENENDIVMIQDAARPNTSLRIIHDCIEATKRADGAMPVITVKDTIYLSRDHQKITELLNRDELFAGQAPESFRFAPYFEIHNQLKDLEIGLIRGSSEAAFSHGMNIELVEGEEANFKITTKEDLDKFEALLKK